MIPEPIRELIIKKYYAKIPKKVGFEHIIHDKTFIASPLKHIALYGDHGLHHVINVVEQVPTILKAVLGIYIPKRSNKRLEFIRNYGTLIGFIHDIGMSDVSLFGRTMHGEFIAQEVFKSRFNTIFKALWAQNVGNIPWTLLYGHHQGWFKEPPELVFRELLSLSICHRKTLVPVDILNDPKKLQKQMQYYISHNLKYQYYINQLEKAKKDLAKAKYERAKNLKIFQKNFEIAEKNLAQAPKQELDHSKLRKQLAKYYHNFETECFAWVLTKNNQAKTLFSDVIDTLRIIRCSDALRQRGTELKTSAQFQIFVNQFTACAIYALTNKKGNIYFLELDDEIASGEANITSSSFTKEGDLRFEFLRGFFHTPTATLRALNYLAALIVQLDYDISDTFIRNEFFKDGFKSLKRPKILLEKTEDNPEFTNLLLKKIATLNPELAKATATVPSLKNIPHLEYQRYLEAKIFAWNNKEKQELLNKIALSGHKVKHIDINKAFLNARITRVKTQEIICEAKTFSGFVYFPFSHGLQGIPTGSYSPFKVAAYTPLGNTGVIRGDVRNATIIAKKPLELLIIPKDDYLQYWFATYTRDEFLHAIL